MSGKGSSPRPFSVDQKTFDANWDRIFRKENILDVTPEEEALWKEMESKSVRKGTCGCGRSPTGDCIGWHGLTEEQFRVKLAEYQQTQKA